MNVQQGIVPGDVQATRAYILARAADWTSLGALFKGADITVLELDVIFGLVRDDLLEYRGGLYRRRDEHPFPPST